MKNILILLTVITIVGCNPPSKETPNLSGAYNMVSQTITSEDESVNDVVGILQLKVYTDSHMMYVHFDPLDSSASFGIGTYLAEPGRITENVVYNATDSVINESGGSYILDIEMKPDGYQQVIKEMNANEEKVTLTENYKLVGTGTTSPLDGAWKEVKTYNIVNGDTSVFPITQFKTYYDGHFMYGYTYRDATDKAHTGMGFGTFEMVSDTQVKELVGVSTSGNNGRTFDIEIEFNGPDEFKQTIKDETGAANVEIYQRLPK